MRLPHLGASSTVTRAWARAGRRAAGLAASLASIALLLTGASSATGQTFSACLNAPGFSCTGTAVPLDRSGALPGTIPLAIERRQAGAVPSEDAVLALAGGPGQAAIPLASVAAQALAPALGSRDLVVFDQRGTGASGPLHCSALEHTKIGSVGRAFERCAAQIGPARGSYTTQESVADIEAIRQTLGYRRLVLFGVSYGTKVALEYAERYPANVEALVLDSVVPTGAFDPFSLASFKAMRGAFSELCSANACAHITRTPLADLARLAAHMHSHALTGVVYDGSGHRHGASMSETQLLDLVLAGDLNPALRALLPAAVHSALRGDPASLLRLNLLSEGLIPNVPLAQASGQRDLPLARSSGGVDESLFVDTSCEEAAFPWQRTAPPATKTSEALAALHAASKAAFYPFDAATEWASSLLEGCAHWPNVAPAPPAPPAASAGADAAALRRAGRAHADLERASGTPAASAGADAAALRRAGRAHADLERASGTCADTRGAVARRALHRPLGARQRLQRMRRERRQELLRGSLGPTVPESA